MGCHARKVGLAIGALLLASCARNEMETTADARPEPGASAEQESDEASIVVTGSSISINSGRTRKANESYAMSPPAPPPPVMARPAIGWSLP